MALYGICGKAEALALLSTGEKVMVRVLLSPDYISGELFGASGLRPHCLLQFFPLCLVEESISVGLVILTSRQKNFKMSILSFKLALVAAPAVESHEGGKN